MLLNIGLILRIRRRRMTFSYRFFSKIQKNDKTARKYRPFLEKRMPSGASSHDRGKRRGRGFDRRAQFREHGEDAVKCGDGEDGGEKKSFVHGVFLSLKKVFLEFWFQELDAGSNRFLSADRKSFEKQSEMNGIRLKNERSPAIFIMIIQTRRIR